GKEVTHGGSHRLRLRTSSQSCNRLGWRPGRKTKLGRVDQATVSFGMGISAKRADAFPSSLPEKLYQLRIHDFISRAFAVENGNRRDQLDGVPVCASTDVDERAKPGHRPQLLRVETPVDRKLVHSRPSCIRSERVRPKIAAKRSKNG